MSRLDSYKRKIKQEIGIELDINPSYARMVGTECAVANALFESGSAAKLGISISDLKCDSDSFSKTTQTIKNYFEDD